MRGLRQDLRFAFRIFSRTPGLTAVVVLSLALGIGANTAIFSLVNTVLLKPLPFRDAEELVIVWEDATFVGFPQNTPAPANYFDWKTQNTVFSGMAAAATGSFNLTGAGEPVRLDAYYVTADFFPLLGVKPVRGRIFLPEEDLPNANQVVMLSYAAWQTLFGKSDQIIGKQITLNNGKHTVVGVLPAGFQFLDPERQIWAPMGFTEEQKQNRNGHFLEVVARLKKGVSLQQARSQMAGIMDRIAKQYPDQAANLGIAVVPLREQIVGDVRGQLILLLLAVAFVLLIACANIANLLLSVATARKKEIAVRAALGAGRSRLIRQMLIESLLLSLTGGIVGLLFGLLSFSFLKNMIPLGLTASAELKIDSLVLLYTAVISIATGLLFGLAPSLHASKADLNEALKSGGGRSGLGTGRVFRNVLVVAETSLALVLLVGAALLIQTIYKLQNQDIGFGSKNVLRVETRLPQPEYESHAKRVAFYQEVLERIERLPGVLSAGYSTAVPLDWKGGTNGYVWEGRPLGPGEMLDSNHREVSTKLLQTLGIRLIEGRYFDGTETEESRPVAIINQAMARTYSQTESALGKCFQTGDTPCFTVIGIVQNIRNMGLDVEPKGEMYFPLRQAHLFGYSFFAPKELLIKTNSDSSRIIPEVRGIIRSVNPRLPLSNVMTLEDILDREIAHRRITMTLLVAFAVLALVLAAIGLYGVLSYFVNQQTPEIGVRLALGAQPGGILLLIVRRGMILALSGIVIGAAAAVALAKIMESLLYGVSAKDPATLILVTALLAITALAACLLPGRRAMKVDPLTALRYE